MGGEDNKKRGKEINLDLKNYRLPKKKKEDRCASHEVNGDYKKTPVQNPNSRREVTEKGTRGKAG